MHFPLLLVLAMTAASEPLPPGDTSRTLEVDGLKRSYLIHVPPSHDGKKPTPVVLALHGGGSNPEQMARFSNLNAEADRRGFLAVYPAGTGRLPSALTWNGGNCCGYAMRHQVNDVAFVGAVLDDLQRRDNVDARRIYATGMSNGAIMCYLLASKMSRRIAAIAPVAGPMGTATCSPERPVPVIHFHGTEDKFAPFAGGTGERSITQTNFYSVDHSIGAWIKANGCAAKPIEVAMPHTSDDAMSVTRRTHGGGRGNSEVVLYIIHGGGHTWPGENPKLRFLGPSTQDISANALMWEFFTRHPLP